MAAPTNLATTMNIAGNREDLEDTIYRVAPSKTRTISRPRFAPSVAIFCMIVSSPKRDMNRTRPPFTWRAGMTS